MACLDLLLHVGRHSPDKAIDLIDEACATTRMQVAAKQKKLNIFVCPEHVALVGIIYT